MAGRAGVVQALARLLWPAAAGGGGSSTQLGPLLSWRRPCTTNAATAATPPPSLARFLPRNATLPPVDFADGMPVPTALKWLRNRGPDLPYGYLNQLFKQGKVRMYDPETDKVRVLRRGARELRRGQVLLVTRESLVKATAAAATASEADEEQSSTSEAEDYDGSKSSSALALVSRGAARARDRSSSSEFAAAAAASGRGRSRSKQRRTMDAEASGTQKVAVAAEAAVKDHGGGGGGDDDDDAADPPDSEVEALVRRVSSDQLAAMLRAGGADEGENLPVLSSLIEQAARQVGAGGAADRGGGGPSVFDRPPPPPYQLLRKPDPRYPRPPDAEDVRRWVLDTEPDYYVINKPAGYSSHGHDDSIAELCADALRLTPHDDPKLVHRLDRLTSGLMLVARNATAASWLSACFRSRSRRAAEEDEAERAAAGGGGVRTRAAADDKGDEQLPDDMFVKKVYWAFVAGRLTRNREGRISRGIVAKNGFVEPAVTYYRVKAASPALSWVELIPETGRRHQLRKHCLMHFGAPILGDTLYGFKGLLPPGQQQLPREWAHALSPQWLEAFSSPPLKHGPTQMPLFLHARKLIVKKSGKGLVRHVAPLPRYMAEVIDALSWPRPKVM